MKNHFSFCHVFGLISVILSFFKITKAKWGRKLIKISKNLIKSHKIEVISMYFWILDIFGALSLGRNAPRLGLCGIVVPIGSIDCPNGTFQLIAVCILGSWDGLFRKPLHFLSIFPNEISNEWGMQTTTSWKVLFGQSIEPMNTTISQKSERRNVWSQGERTKNSQNSKIRRNYLYYEILWEVSRF